MAKSLNELTNELKEFMLDCAKDPRHPQKVKYNIYNALEIKIDKSKESSPHIIVSQGLSEAIFSIKTGKKIKGGLGADEKYVLKWLARGLVIQKLNDTWNAFQAD